MALSPWLGGLQAAEGLYGLFSGGNNQANGYYAAAARNLQQRLALSQELRKMADAYNPQADTQQSVDFASQVAGKSLTQALGNLNAGYEAAGGNPGGDTRFNVSAQGAADRIYDPLKTFAAQQASQNYARKMAAYQEAVAADNGSIAGQYMQLGNTVRTDPSSSYGMLASGLRSFLPSSGGASAGAGSVAGYDPSSGGWGNSGYYGPFANPGAGNAMMLPQLGGTDPLTGTPMAGSMASPYGVNPFQGAPGGGPSDPLSGWSNGSALGAGMSGGQPSAPRVGQARTQVAF